MLEIVEGEANESSGCASVVRGTGDWSATRREVLVSMGWCDGKNAGVETPSMPSRRPRNKRALCGPRDLHARDAGTMLSSGPS